MGNEKYISSELYMEKPENPTSFAKRSLRLVRERQRNRKSASFLATVHWEDTFVSCMTYNIDDKGVCVQFLESAELPEYVELIIPKIGMRRIGNLRWIKGDRAGFEFCDEGYSL